MRVGSSLIIESLTKDQPHHILTRLLNSLLTRLLNSILTRLLNSILTRLNICPVQLVMMATHPNQDKGGVPFAHKRLPTCLLLIYMPYLRGITFLYATNIELKTRRCSSSSSEDDILCLRLSGSPCATHLANRIVFSDSPPTCWFDVSYYE